MRILGISAFRHDSAAALLEKGQIIAATQEERFTRKKHETGFPTHAIASCLNLAGCRLDQIEHLVFCGQSTEGQIISALATHGGWNGELSFIERHAALAAAAFFPSPYQDAAVLTLDGGIEGTTSSCSLGSGNRLESLWDISAPHSIGRLYSAITGHIGFKVNSGEYKVMGLAPYGAPRYADLIRDRLIDIKEDGRFLLASPDLAEERLTQLFGHPARRPDQDPLTQFHMDMAASIQEVTEHIVLKLARSVRKETGAKNLCLAGGVALNCVANGKLLREGLFDGLWVQPAAGDAGGALGAALAGYHLHLKQPRQADGRKDAMRGSYLGPEWKQDDIEARLTATGARFTVLDDAAVISATAQGLAEEKAVGWMQGRMEFGPRALGDRSILGDPRSPTMQKLLNLKVKYRESFRPFAPSVLREDVAEWFELENDSPYMLLVAPVAEKHRRAMTAEEQALFGIEKLNVPRSSIPAVTHVDYSARIQTVHADTNPRYHALISAFKGLTGCGVVVNTSFNVRGEPIVCTPEDAFRCFMGSEIELLVVGNCFLKKEDQDPALKLDYKNAFEND